MCSGNFPLILLRLSFDMYTWANVISISRISARGAFGTRGITAGAYSATYELKGLMVVEIRSHARLYPEIGLLIHVDDIAQETTGSKESCIENRHKQTMRVVCAPYCRTVPYLAESRL